MPGAKAKQPIHVHLVHNFVSLKSIRSEGSIFAFTSARRGEGVTHVVQALAKRLGVYTHSKVLVISFAELAGLSAFAIRHFEDRSQEQVPGVWLVNRDQSARSLISSTALISATLEEEVWAALRAKFQYILIDCPALDSGSQVLSLGGQIDGTVLVVRAGFGQKREIQQAVRLLCAGPARLLGCVLNRRSFPIPRQLFRFL